MLKYPVIESFRDADHTGYQIHAEAAGDQVAVAHEPAEYLKELIKNGKAEYLTVVSDARTMFRETTQHKEPNTTVALNMKEMLDDPTIEGMIVATKAFKHTEQSAENGVSPLWVGEQMEVEKGDILAIGPSQRPTDGSLLQLIDAELDTNLVDGMKVEIVAGESFRFKARCSLPLWRHISDAQSPGKPWADRAVATECLRKAHAEHRDNDQYKSYDALATLVQDIEDAGYSPQFNSTGWSAGEAIAYLAPYGEIRTIGE